MKSWVVNVLQTNLPIFLHNPNDQFPTQNLLDTLGILYKIKLFSYLFLQYQGYIVNILNDNEIRIFIPVGTFVYIFLISTLFITTICLVTILQTSFLVSSSLLY